MTRPGGSSCSPDPVWGWDAIDINRSGWFEMTDVLELIDLLNGAGAYEPWINATVPNGDTVCR